MGLIMITKLMITKYYALLQR